MNPLTTGKQTSIRTFFIMSMLFFISILTASPADAIDSGYHDSGNQIEQEKSDTLYFLLRVDDIYFRSDSYAGWNVPHNFTAFQDAVEAFGGKVTWGVIPHRLKEGLNEGGHMERDLQKSADRGHEISVHGYTHYCPLDCDSGPFGHEMYCPTLDYNFSYEEQAEILENAIQTLSDYMDVPLTSFIAPGHSLDQTTYEVLVDFDLHVVSNFRSSDGQYPKEVTEGLIDVPVHQEYTWVTESWDYQESLDTAIADIKDRGEADGFYNLMLHDPFIRPGYKDGLIIEWIEELLDYLTEYYGDRIRFVTLTEAADILYDREPTSAGDDQEFASELPDNVRVGDNYPNPFNPETTIRYELPASMNARLEVFDALGRKVTLLKDEMHSAGNHEVIFDASGLPSGVYMYRLVTSGQTQTGRMLLVK
ncbi:DUF2334 domain-containing protein [Natronogracilivirga saccharolytica]|uniref:DUF2334 domain-containing protein n=1 Tax=Natronogracilivirga saccharolytica TaxID=2812953 RepID=A0A8J7RN82_9BACT|nr:DUF2334 domain-containing protein [Natronogracilivirga saccharolytica]MBP3193143.1 DUF2334 domain-containing protein [Natronogracilivirga saccharolytica]